MIAVSAGSSTGQYDNIAGPYDAHCEFGGGKETIPSHPEGALQCGWIFHHRPPAISCMYVHSAFVIRREGEVNVPSAC